VRRRYEDAIPALEKAIELGSSNVEYYYELGLSYIYLDQCDKGVPWLIKAVEMDPNAVAAWGGLALCPEQPGENRPPTPLPTPTPEVTPTPGG
jgi:tetratricopeptide (TPR) repeat protein